MRATVFVLTIKEVLEKEREREIIEFVLYPKSAIFAFVPKVFSSCSKSQSLASATRDALDHNDSCSPFVIAIRTLLATILAVIPQL